MKMFTNLALFGAVAIMALAPALAAPQRGYGGGNRANAGAMNANRGGGGMKANNREVRSMANSSVNRGGYNKPNRGGYNNGYGNGNRPGQRGNVVVVNNGRPGGYGNGYNNGYNNNNWDRDDGDSFGEFVGKTAAITAGVAAVTAIAKSGNNDNDDDNNTTNVNGQDCQQQISNGQVYVNCNGTWFQPVQMGTQTGYQPSQPPR